jgi:hypothetical protein
VERLHAGGRARGGGARGGVHDQRILLDSRQPFLVLLLAEDLVRLVALALGTTVAYPDRLTYVLSRRVS